LFKTKLDVDHIRGMHTDEAYFLSHSEIIERLQKAGFSGIQKKRFFTQWGLNAMYIGWKSKNG
jgi:hypothetical protein